jgi:hypothetical protein
MMLVDAIAIVILMGMMFVPLVNVVVGAIVGSGLGGFPGGLAGVAVAIAITLAEKVIGDRRGWFRVACQFEHVADDIAAVRTTTTRRLPAPRRRVRVLRKKPAPHPTVPFAETYSRWLH